MSLPPGTRIPELTPYEQGLLDDARRATDVAEALAVHEWRQPRRSEWLHILALTAAAWTTGLLVGMCIAALAWAHMGG